MTYPYDTIQEALKLGMDALKDDRPGQTLIKRNNAYQALKLTTDIIHGLHMKAHRQDNDMEAFRGIEDRVRELKNFLDSLKTA